MVEKPALTQLLRANARISGEAALVYKHVLTVGTLTIGEVCEYTGFEYDVALKALKELIDGRLVRKLEHVVDRYVAVAPYRVFAEHLVDFQRTVKEVEEDAKKSVDKTLVEISRVSEEWKGSATRMREEEIARVKEETGRLKEEYHTARNSLIEKLRRETEEKKSGITETLKNHVEEHTTRVSEIEKDISLKLDNSTAKFADATNKLREEIAQVASSYLSRFDEKMQLFLNVVSSDLGAFNSGFSSSIQEFRGEVLAVFDESKKKVGENVQTVKTGTDSLLHEFEQTYTQLSTELQRAVSSNIGSTIEAISSGNKELESILKIMLQKQNEKLSEDVGTFETKARTAIDLWRSAYKAGLANQANSLKLSIEDHQQALIQKLESTKAPMSELLKTYSASAKNETDELGSNLSVIAQSIKKDMYVKLDTPRNELQNSCDIASKSCITLSSTLESLSKKNIPLTSKTIEDFILDFKGKLSKMKATLVEDAKSFLSDIREEVLKTVSAVEKIPPSGRGVPASAARKGSDPPSEFDDDPPTVTAGSVKTDTTRAKSALLKEATKKMDEAGKTYIEATKKSIDSLDKSISEKTSTVLKFEDELTKKWESITATTARVTQLAEYVKSFPSEIGKPIDELFEQYGGKIDASLSSTKRLLNTYLSSLGDQASNAQRMWSATVDKVEKELSDLLIKKQDDIMGFVSKQSDIMQQIAVDRGKQLRDLASSGIEVSKSQSLTAQSTTTRFVDSNIERTRVLLGEAESKLKGSLEASAQGLRQAIKSESDENDSLSARTIDETAKVTDNLKEQFNTVVDRKREEIRQLCQEASSKLKETISENSRELHSIVSSLASSFSAVVNAASEEYRKECDSTKVTIISLLSEHLKNYLDAVAKIMSEIDSIFSRHFSDCSEITAEFAEKLDDILTTHQNGYDEYSNKMLRGLTNCMDRDEAALNENANKMVREFTESTEKIAKESNSVETLMRTAWAEVTDTQQVNSDKTWHYVTMRAVLNHLKDMTRRTKSTVTIVVPKLDEAPLKEIKEISKAIRINLVAGIDETYHKKLLKELLTQGNVRIWSLTERDYISCTRDAEEVLIAPVAKRDLDCVATVSVEESYVKLYHKFIGPMWMASSREVKEKELR